MSGQHAATASASSTEAQSKVGMNELSACLIFTYFPPFRQLPSPFVPGSLYSPVNIDLKTQSLVPAFGKLNNLVGEAELKETSNIKHLTSSRLGLLVTRNRNPTQTYLSKKRNCMDFRHGWIQDF